MYADDWTLDLGLQVADEPPPLTTAQGAKRSVSGMVDECIESGAATSLDDLIRQVSNFRQYRLFNALLAVLQLPNPRLLLPAHEWASRWRRTIRPEQRPLVLLLPNGPVMFLYDVSQTEGNTDSRSLPAALQNPYAMKHVRDADYALSWLSKNAKHDGVRITEGRRGQSSAGHIKRSLSGQKMRVDSRDGQVVAEMVTVRFECMLNQSYSETERLATLAHELGHLYCGHLGSGADDWWPTRTELSHEQDEFEAETAAQLAFRRIAPAAKLPDHLDQYNIDENRIDADWGAITRAADRIIAMSQGSSPKRR
ncbi:uncharacterized protein DUF955 [Terracoccus luteus]|uniref:Uncharacterized protein DUF955 n=1 Tax=Terracoccus luteus TaxID=53356 RepID=A0A495XVR8_9MICO|nr:ImmA/IrrE family metallo-endopeptidase [Terracoccus luteus]RKT78671.1 uncharacterized protein DUF955 [Terracoccus luteus]